MEILNCRQIYIYLNRLNSIQFILRNLITFKMSYFYLVFFSIHIHHFSFDYSMYIIVHKLLLQKLKKYINK